VDPGSLPVPAKAPLPPPPPHGGSSSSRGSRGRSLPADARHATQGASSIRPRNASREPASSGAHAGDRLFQRNSVSSGYGVGSNLERYSVGSGRSRRESSDSVDSLSTKGSLRQSSALTRSRSRSGGGEGTLNPLQRKKAAEAEAHAAEEARVTRNLKQRPVAKPGTNRDEHTWIGREDMNLIEKDLAREGLRSKTAATLARRREVTEERTTLLHKYSSLKKESDEFFKEKGLAAVEVDGAQN